MYFCLYMHTIEYSYKQSLYILHLHDVYELNHGSFGTLFPDVSLCYSQLLAKLVTASSSFFSNPFDRSYCWYYYDVCMWHCNVFGICHYQRFCIVCSASFVLFICITSRLPLCLSSLPAFSWTKTNYEENNWRKQLVFSSATLLLATEGLVGDELLSVFSLVDDFAQSH